MRSSCTIAIGTMYSGRRCRKCSRNSCMDKLCSWLLLTT